jgi:hypothetical protein
MVIVSLHLSSLKKPVLLIISPSNQTSTSLSIPYEENPPATNTRRPPAGLPKGKICYYTGYFFCHDCPSSLPATSPFHMPQRNKRIGFVLSHLATLPVVDPTTFTPRRYQAKKLPFKSNPRQLDCGYTQLEEKETPRGKFKDAQEP